MGWEILKWSLPINVAVLWMIGGQLIKGVRRFGVPGLTLMVALIDKWKKEKKDWAVLVFVLLIPVLCMGYGVNSFLMKIFKKDWIVRVAYAIILSLPFLAYTLLSPQYTLLQYGIITVSLIGAFQVRAGTLAKIGKYDILIEDIIRGLTLGGALLWMMG